jgi:hypothetical protein
MSAGPAPAVSPWLPRFLRLLAVFFLLFFGGALAMVLSGLDQTLLGLSCGPAVLGLARWGNRGGGGQDYELMIAVIYLVWGAFLWRAAVEPLRHRLFIDFTVAANVGHFGLMLLQSLLLTGERMHLAGDVLLGWLCLIPVIVLWLPVRARALAAS